MATMDLDTRAALERLFEAAQTNIDQSPHVADCLRLITGISRNQFQVIWEA